MPTPTAAHRGYRQASTCYLVHFCAASECVINSHVAVIHNAQPCLNSLSTSEAHLAQMGRVQHPTLMKPTSPAPSSRLLRAAAAEATELRRHNAALAQRRERMLSDLAELDAALAETNERLVLIERITGPPGRAEEDGAERSIADEAALPGGSAVPQPEEMVLRGPAIRQAAVRILLGDPRKPDALHYKEWFGLLIEAGYSVAGKIRRRFS